MKLTCFQVAKFFRKLEDEDSATKDVFDLVVGEESNFPWCRYDEILEEHEKGELSLDADEKKDLLEDVVHTHKLAEFLTEAAYVIQDYASEVQLILEKFQPEEDDETESE